MSQTKPTHRGTLDSACEGHTDVLTEVGRSDLLTEAEQNCYPEADHRDVYAALVGTLTARADEDPAFDVVAADVVRQHHFREVTAENPRADDADCRYRDIFAASIERGADIPFDTEETFDWDTVRDHVAEHGMWNSDTMAVAPTATTSIIAGTTLSVESACSNLYVKSNVSGEFTMLNDALFEDLKTRDLWDERLGEQLTCHDRSIQEIDRVPDEQQERYRGAFEIDPHHQLRLAAVRGQWVDQSQSVDVFFPSTDGSLLDDVHKTARTSGLKTIYYLRTLGASQVEKTTLDMDEYDDTQTRDETVAGNDDEANSAPTCDACQ